MKKEHFTSFRPQTLHLRRKEWKCKNWKRVQKWLFREKWRGEKEREWDVSFFVKWLHPPSLFRFTRWCYIFPFLAGSSSFFKSHHDVLHVRSTLTLTIANWKAMKAMVERDFCACVLKRLLLCCASPSSGCIIFSLELMLYFKFNAFTGSTCFSGALLEGRKERHTESLYKVEKLQL